MPDLKKYEKQFFEALRDIFIGAKVEGDSGFINLMRIKSLYYEQGVFPRLLKDINTALQPFPDFREELFDKLYTFFQRYFSESGSIYFRYTALHQNVYEKVYTDDRDVMLFWKTHMLYYVKTDRIFTSLNVELDGVKFFFDASKMELKKANEKRETVYTFRKAEEDGTLVFDVAYSEKGKTTKVDEILKAVKKSGQELTDETLAQAFRVFEKQSEVDYFINKNARSFLQEQFELWLYQYLFAGQNVWSAERLAQLQTLKAIAFKVIDFISQFEDELVKIWNKPKFVRNSHYVVTLDRIANPPLPPLEKGGESVTSSLIRGAGEDSAPPFPRGAGGDSGFAVLERLLVHPGMQLQVAEWQALGMIGDDFEPEDVLFTPGDDEPYTLNMFAPKVVRDGGLLRSPYHLPYNPKLVERARELRKNMTPAERKLWNGFLRNFRFPVLRQRPIDQYIVDFYCAQLKLVIEIDGDSHFTEVGKANDAQRTQMLEGYGLRVVRFTNTQVMQEFDAVCQAINESPLPPLERGGKQAGDDFQGIKEDTAYYAATPPLQRGVGGDSLHPQYRYLPLDTRYFPDLELDILALFDDLDAALDGWLVHSENYQALNTMLNKLRGRVNTIYIDPPYNTAATEIIYSNKFKNSSWLAFMENRLTLSMALLATDGVYTIAIDDTEMVALGNLLEQLFTNYDRNMVVVNHHPAGAGLEGTNISTTHEYAIFMTPRGKKVLFGDKKNHPVGKIGFIRTGTADSNLRIGRPNSFYAVLVDPKTSTVVGAEPPPTSNDYPRNHTKDGMIRIYPLGSDGEERVWRRSYESCLSEINENNIECKNNRTLYLLSDDSEKHKPIFSNWTDTKYNAGAHGTNLLSGILGIPLFSYPKSIFTVTDCVNIATIHIPKPIILDYFAGSGTTAHAVMNLNRQDGGKRKYILVEMGEHFNTVILPRIKKVAFCSKWKDGKPNPPLPPLRKGGKASAPPSEWSDGVDSTPPLEWSDGVDSTPPLKRGVGGDSDGMSHFVKYYELEQYEDVLRRARYADADLFDNPYEDPYHRYVFLRDVKNLDALEIEADKNAVHFHPERLYPKNPPLPPLEQGGKTTAPPLQRWAGEDSTPPFPRGAGEDSTPPFPRGAGGDSTPPFQRGAGGDSDIDLAETLSHLRGKWIRRITAEYVEFQDGERISLTNPDWRLLKPLIWWR